MDIATTWDEQAGVGDWAIRTAGLSAQDDLYTAVLISLFTDAEAGDDDLIPDGTSDPRGWWAEPIGSKLWLMVRKKATPALLAIAKTYCEEALAWIVEDGVAASIEILTEFTRPGLLGIEVILRRSDGTRRALRFSRLWENI